MTFAREAVPFVLPPALLAVLLLALLEITWGLAFGLAALAMLAFFRIPRRRSSSDSAVVLAAANGRVLRVDSVEEPALGTGLHRRIATFLSVFDVHVQRAPVSGEVIVSRRQQGRKLAAFRAAADRLNESHLTVLRRPNGDLVAVRQIAGLVARRVVCYPGIGSRLERGELLGLIKFGSRVDLYVPSSYRVEVVAGQRVVEGATPVAGPPAQP